MVATGTRLWVSGGAPSHKGKLEKLESEQSLLAVPRLQFPYLRTHWLWGEERQGVLLERGEFGRLLGRGRDAGGLQIPTIF